MAAAVVSGSLLVMTACTQRTPPASGPAAEVRHPTADATVDEERPSTNYGLKPTLVVNDDHGGRANNWSYLRFDLGADPGSIASATLRVYVDHPSPARPTVARASNSWSEQKVTWKNRPRPTGAAIPSAGGVSGGWMQWDVTSLLPAKGRFTLVLRSTSAHPVDISSRSGPHPPALVLDAAGPGAPGAPPSTTAAATTAPATTAPATTSPPTTLPPTTAPPTTARATTEPPTTTLPATDPRIAAVGDIACDPSRGGFNGGNGTANACHEMAVSQLVADGSYDAFLALGDLQYENGAADAFKGSYDPSFGRVLSITHPAPGNHEYQTHGAAGYYEYFGARAGDPTKGYYSFDIGKWHIVALNSNCGAVSCAAGSPQEQWLRADLAAHPTLCSLVYWHHPLYSSGQHGDNRNMAALYQAAYDGGVDVALVGHDHDYERFTPQDAAGNADPSGIREFVVGTGGRSHYRLRTVEANSEIHNSHTFGVLALALPPGSYEWSFVPEPGGQFTDSGSQGCH